jgi:hypothetical protein
VIPAVVVEGDGIDRRDGVGQALSTSNHRHHSPETPAAIVSPPVLADGTTSIGGKRGRSLVWGPG